MTVQSPTKHLIFLHIPKTAGTTLALVLSRQYIGQPVSRLYDAESNKRFRKMTQTERDRFACVMGHPRFGIHQMFSSETTYITMLRDPLQQVVSSYHFVRKLDWHTRYESAHTLSLADYVEKFRHGERQTRLLTGAEDFEVSTRAVEPLPDNALAVAKQNLDTYFSVVGLTEAFDMSLMLLQHVLGWKNVHYVQRNINHARPRELDTATLTRLETLCATDLELYAYARQRFDEQVASFAPQIHDDLERFHSRNRLYSRVYGPTQALRSTRLYRTVRRTLAGNN